MPFHDALPFDTLHKAKIDTDLDANLPATPEGIGDVYFAPDGNGGQGALYMTNAAGDAWLEFTGTGGGGATVLDDLTDVDTLGVTTGQVLTYNGGVGEWQPQDVATNLADLLDIDLTGLVDGDVIIYDSVGGEWVRATKVNALADLSDVANFTQVKGDIMVSDGGLFDALNVGTDGQSLFADSSEPLGVKWEEPFTANRILTADGEVLVDVDGNVMTEDF